MADRNPDKSAALSPGCFLGPCGNKDSGDAPGSQWLIQKAAPAVWKGHCQKKSSNLVRVSGGEDTSNDLAKEMNELSFQEREKVLDDIHGVAPVQVENPEEIKSCLKSMDQLIGMVSKPKRKALDRAIFLRPSLQNDDAFKLMFLRADQYDAHKAARRMVQYFEFKQELFGVDKVAKDLTLDDLDENAKGFLDSLGSIVLPKKDSSDRRTIVCSTTNFHLDDPKSMLRCVWYQLMGMLEDETVQMKGICVVSNCFGDVMAQSSTMSAVTSLIAGAGNMISSLPIRVMSDHFCYDDARLQYIMSAIRVAFAKSIRLRIRTHFGSPIEVQYALLTFGIDCSDLLGDRSTDDGFEDDRRRDFQRDYIAKRRDIERQAADRRASVESSSGIIDDPRSHDVLVGRGRPYQEYCGNRYLARYTDDYVDQFNKSDDRFEKTIIFMKVVKHIKELSGRYIERTSTGWTVVNDTVARNKTASGFRSKAKSLVRRGRGDDGGDHSSNSEEDRNAKRQRNDDVDLGVDLDEYFKLRLS